jgi:tellurite resistance protein TerC
MSVPLWGWFAAVGLILVLLVVDIVVNRGNAEPTIRRALVASAAWIGMSIAFGVFLGLVQGSGTAEQFFAGYVAEKSLSIDNIFVFVLLFRTLAVPATYQHRVLYYGVVGALGLRAGFIAAGAALLDNFSWILYVFGAFLLVAGVRMLRGENEVDPRAKPDRARCPAHLSGNARLRGRPVLYPRRQAAVRHAAVRRPGGD